MEKGSFGQTQLIGFHKQLSELKAKVDVVQDKMYYIMHNYNESVQYIYKLKIIFEGA